MPDPKMWTHKQYLKAYQMGIEDGRRSAFTEIAEGGLRESYPDPAIGTGLPRLIKPRKRKLSAWNKFVKANSKKPRFRMRSGKLNLKKMAVAFRKTPAGKKKRR